MVVEDRDIIDQAIDWHLRQDQMTADEWRAFVDWIDASPAHAAAFDTIALDDSLLDIRSFDEIPIPVAANDESVRIRSFRSWRWVAGGSVLAAACAMIVVLMPQMRQSSPDYYGVTTQAGQKQELALRDGTRIEMSGGTKMQLDHNDPRYAELVSGEAIFHVRHDASAPFTVHSAGLAIRDLGTVFNVAREGKQLRLQVAEGSVLFQPDREAVTLKPGGALVATEDNSQIVISHIDPTMVGAWRSGLLSFTEARLSDVAKAVERHSGGRLAIESSMAAKPFTGVIRLTGAMDRDIMHIADLVGANARRDGEYWRLEPDGRSEP